MVERFSAGRCDAGALRSGDGPEIRLRNRNIRATAFFRSLAA
jgi:hypothetical protein